MCIYICMIGVGIYSKPPPPPLRELEHRSGKGKRCSSHFHLLVLFLASVTAASSSRFNALLRSIPWLKSSNFLLFPQISHVSGVINLLTQAPATITTQKEIIKYPGRFDLAITS